MVKYPVWPLFKWTSMLARCSDPLAPNPNTPKRITAPALDLATCSLTISTHSTAFTWILTIDLYRVLPIDPMCWVRSITSSLRVRLPQPGSGAHDRPPRYEAPLFAIGPQV